MRRSSKNLNKMVPMIKSDVDKEILMIKQQVKQVYEDQVK